MGAVQDAFNLAFRSYVTAGVPASGENEPDKAEIRAIGAAVEDLIATAGIADAIYESTSDGLAGTTDGQLFLVKGDGTTSAFDLYQNDGGSAVDLNISLPSSAYVQGLFDDALEAVAAQALIVSNITTTSGDKLLETSALFDDDGGADLIFVGGRAVGWTIPAGQTGAGTYVIPLISFTEQDARRLTGSTIRIRHVATVTAGYLADTPFGGNAVQVQRQDGSTDLNEGSALAATQTGTRLVRDFLYTMQGNERFVGGTMQVAVNDPTGAERSLQTTSVTWDVVATPADDADTGADKVLDARFAALAPAVDIFDTIEPIFQLAGGAETIVSDGGKVEGIALTTGETGQNTIMQWRRKMNGRLRDMLPGRQVRITLGFNTTSGWNRAHALEMQVRDVELGLTSLVTSNIIDKQISPTRRKMSFTCLIPAVTVIDDLRPLVRFTDTNGAAGTEMITLTDATIEFFHSGSDLLGNTAATNLLGDEVARSSSVEQAVAQATGTGAAVASLLSSSSFASIAAALELATALAAPGAQAAVNVPYGVYNEHSLGLITSGTDGDNVILRGEGKGRTKIVGYLAPNTAVATIQATSTLDFNGSQTIENLSVTAQNMRYGAHIDSVKFKPNARQVWRNCDVTHLGNAEADAYWSQNVWVSQHAYALGTTSGSYFGFFDCNGTAPRAAFSAHDQIDFTDPSTVEIVGGKWTATNTAGWSLRAESIGFGMMNRFIVRDATLSGDISMAVTPWLPTALDQQPADHRAWEMTGSGNSPAAFRIEDFGRALRITSATTGTASKVVISGNVAPRIFGKSGTEGITRVDGDVGLNGYAYGWADIQDSRGVGPSSNLFITSLGARLGNRSGAPETLTVQVDGLAPINIVFDQNYTAMTNDAVIAAMNAALGGVAIVSEYAVGNRYRPYFSDEEKSLQNTSGTMILMGMALAADTNGGGTVRPMTASDLPSAFAGIAWEDIRPNAYGRVKTGGWLPTTDLLRSDGGSPEPGTTFTIDPAKPGFVLSNNVSWSGILPVIRGSLGAGLWTVAVRTQIDGQAIGDNLAAEVAERAALIERESGAEDAFILRDLLRFVLARFSRSGGFRTPFMDVGYDGNSDFMVMDALRQVGFRVAPDGSVSFAGLRFVADNGEIKIVDRWGFVALRLNNTSLKVMGGEVLTKIEDLIARQPSIDKGVSHILQTGPTQMRKWRKSRSDVLVGTGRQLLICIGDSNTMGWDVLGGGIHRRAMAYPRMLAARLNRNLLPANETSFFGQAITTTTVATYNDYDPRISFGSGWGINGVTSLGGQAFANSSTTNALTIEPGRSWDRVELYVALGSAATFTLDVGGGVSSFTPATGSIQRIVYDATPGENVLNIKRVSGDVQIIGGFFHDSADPSLCVLNMGRSGWRASDWTATTNFYSPLSAVLAVLGSETLATVVLELGLNEWNQNINPATYKANMATMIVALMAKADVVLQISLPPSGAKTYAWGAYVQAVYELAATYNLSVHDMTSRLIDFTTASADGFATTALHLSAQGQADKAIGLSNLLSSF
jgi:hypothetical protein